MDNELFLVGIKALIRDSAGRILLVKSTSKVIEHWDLPGGKIQKGADEKQTLKRELFEELGIKSLKKMEFFTAGFSAMDKYFKQRLVLFFYLCEVPMKNIILSHEHSEYGWFTPKQAAKLLKIRLHKEVIEKIKTL